MQPSCCIVGAGPAGMLLALLFARRGVPVTLLEAQKDFDREFRGDTLHPAILELLDQIGLADALHERLRVQIKRNRRRQSAPDRGGSLSERLSDRLTAS